MTSNSWRVLLLGELCEIYDGPHATPKKTDQGPIYLNIANLNQGRLDLSKTDHLSEKDFRKWTRRVTPQPGDIVFSYETRLGEAALIPTELKCCLGRRMGLLRPDTSKVDPQFLLYAYLGPEFQHTIDARTVYGSTVNRILLTEMPSFPISIPSLAEQQTIVRTLSTLDNKIELNRRMNQTLEAIARAIFKSWFVNFDPVRAKMEGRQPVGMDAATAALFPDRLVKSRLGEVPAGWRMEPIGTHVKAVKGLSYKGSGLAKDGLPMHNLNSVYEGGGYKHAGIKYYTGEYKDRHLLKAGDVIVTNTEQGFDLLLIGYPSHRTVK
jgi:type I restriction enzyme S subunit